MRFSSAWTSPGHRPAAVAGAVLIGLILVVGATAPARGAFLVPGEVRVAIATGRENVTVGATAALEIVTSGGAVIAQSPGGDQATFPVRSVGGAISVDGRLFAGPVIVRPAAGSSALVTLWGAPYRGIFEIAAGPDGNLLVVNELEMESYLRGVVPREMPASWPAEALKAQAVAARTYAASQVLAARAAGAAYDLLATTDSQVYGGVRAEHPATDEAVASTAGAVITYQGNLISAVYHSSSGGHTEDSENIWVSYRPYLRGVPDYDQASPQYSWERDMSLDEVTSKLVSSDHKIGRVIAIDPSGEVGASGRPLRVTFRGTEGEVTVRGEDSRRILGLPSSWFEVLVDEEGPANLLGHLEYGDQVVIAGGAPGGAESRVTRRVGQSYCLSYEGTLWRISDYTVIYNQVVTGRVRFEGRGWGHGVGLSQWGARELADRGWAYSDILAHYYTGIALEEQ